MTPPGQAVRRLVGAALLLTTVTALLLLAGGWYFAGQIRADGLATTAVSTPDDLTVVSVAGAAISLREAPRQPVQPALRRPAVYGLAWPTGTGVLGAALTLDRDGSVRRSLEITTGVPPAVGSPARLRRDVFDTPAQATGAAASEVQLPCAGGLCPAWYLPGASRTWAILVHGKGATRTEPLRALGAVRAAGLPALVISYRNDPGAPADPSGSYRYGATEWRDLDEAVRWAQQRGAQRVVLFGFSMGGGIVASFLEHSPRGSAVTALVLDAPMLSFRRTVEFGAAQRSLPVVGLPIPGALTWTARTLAGWRFGIDWAAIDYLDGRWVRVPTLLFHGTADETVPIATSDELHRSHPGLVQQTRVEGAAHLAAWNADPQRYNARLGSFLTAQAGR